MMLSADGYFEGEDHNLDWFVADEEFTVFSDNQLAEADTLIFGRRTFEMMESYWPSDQVEEGDKATAEMMNTYRKVVFSHQPLETDWQNTEVYTGDIINVVNDLKNQQSNSDIAILASSNLCTMLLREGLIDEVRLLTCPVLIGSGTSVFDGLDEKVQLSLDRIKRFNSGNLLSVYSVTK